MPINPLSVPNFGGPYSGGADFAPLGNLGNVYQAQQDRQRQLAALGQLGTDPTQNAMTLIKSGDPKLAQQGLELMNQATAQKRYAQELAIRQSAENRAQKVFEQDSPEYRKQQIIDAGLDPNAPESKVFMATGQNFPTPRVGVGPPSYVRDPQGKVHEFRPSSTGEQVESRYPEGYTPVSPEELAAEKAQGMSMGKARATAIQTLPGLSDQAENDIKSLEDLKTHPGRADATGTIMGQLGDRNILLGQQGIDFRNRLSQVKSQAFLEAYKTLRGGGAISNAEGEKGTQAINRLSTVTSKEEFDQAIKDAQDIYRLGVDRMRRAAKGDFSTHPKELQPTDYTPPPAQKTGKPSLADIFH